MINLGNTAWSFINGTAIALISPRFKRRTMFLTGAIGMLVVYISWTIAMQQTMLALEHNKTNKAAGIVVLFFIYFYSPWYNIGNNALAYSMFNPSHSMVLANVFGSLHGRTIPLRREISGYLNRTILCQRRRFLHQLRQSYWDGRGWVEISHHVYRHDLC
jgi:hypothetical protein